MIPTPQIVYPSSQTHTELELSPDAVYTAKQLLEKCTPDTLLSELTGLLIRMHNDADIAGAMAEMKKENINIDAVILRSLSVAMNIQAIEQNNRMVTTAVVINKKFCLFANYVPMSDEVWEAHTPEEKKKFINSAKIDMDAFLRDLTAKIKFTPIHIEENT